jgi:hypothetical protein
VIDELERLAAEAAVLAGGHHPCAILGHKWKFVGAAGCGCLDGCCSVPVSECTSCGDCDYGDTAEADEIRAKCRESGPS